MARIKYIWGSSKAIQGRWYLGLIGRYSRGKGKQADAWAVSVRGLLLWLIPVVAIVWSVLAWAGYSVVRGNPHNLLTFSDVWLLPARANTVKAKLGQAAIAEGMECARQGRWDEAAALLTTGLRRYPGDRQARLTLAEYALRNNQVPWARRTLADGFTGEYPGRAYLEAWFKVALHAEGFDDIAGICARYLPELERGGFLIEFQWLLDRQWNSLIEAGRHADALVVLKELRPSNFREERRAATLLALQRGEEAAAVLREWRQLPYADLTAVARLEARMLREAGKLDEMEVSLAEVRSRAADDAASWAFTLLQRSLAGRGTAAALALEEIFRRFGGDSASLQLAADAVTEAGAAVLLERCVVLARERKLSEGLRWQRQLVGVHLKRGEWEQASEALQQLPAAPEEEAADRIWREWVRHLLGATRSAAESAQLALLDFCQEQSLSVTRLSETADALLRARRFETAQKVVERGLETFPANPRLTALVREVRLHVLANTPAVSPGPEDIAEQARTRQGFERQFENLVTAQQWAEASRYLSQVQEVQPDWMQRDDSSLRLAQIRVALAQQDSNRLKSAGQMLLTGDQARAEKALGLVRDLMRTGRSAEALALLEELARRHADHPEVRALQMALKPAVPRS